MSPILPLASLLAATLLAAGCATAPDQTAEAKPVTCEAEYRVGSNIPKRDCRPALTDEERRRQIEILRNSKPGG